MKIGDLMRLSNRWLNTSERGLICEIVRVWEGGRLSASSLSRSRRSSTARGCYFNGKILKTGEVVLLWDRLVDKLDPVEEMLLRLDNNYGK